MDNLKLTAIDYAALSPMLILFWNCSSRRVHHGVSGALLSWLGPYSSRRRCPAGSATASS